MSVPELDWASAEVSDSRLTVALAGDPPRGWRRSFETTARLLGHGDWESIEIKKHKVRVTGVQPGSEDKLRHHLEAIVQQANADHAPPEHDDDGDGDQGPEEGGEPEQDGPDADMTERFRSFGT